MLPEWAASRCQEQPVRVELGRSRMAWFRPKKREREGDTAVNTELSDTSAPRLEKLIAAYGDAWNRHDIEGILAMHTDDSVFENHTSGGRGVGKDAIRH